MVLNISESKNASFENTSIAIYRCIRQNCRMKVLIASRKMAKDSFIITDFEDMEKFFLVHDNIIPKRKALNGCPEQSFHHYSTATKNE